MVFVPNNETVPFDFSFDPKPTFSTGESGSKQGWFNGYDWRQSYWYGGSATGDIKKAIEGDSCPVFSTLGTNCPKHCPNGTLSHPNAASWMN